MKSQGIRALRGTRPILPLSLPVDDCRARCGRTDRADRHRRLAVDRRPGARGDGGGLPPVLRMGGPRRHPALAAPRRRRHARRPIVGPWHREHHADPRRVDLIFIPWRAQLWVQPGSIAIALLAFPRPALGLTFLSFLAVLGLAWAEWTHYLVHNGPQTRSAAYRAVWRKPPATPTSRTSGTGSPLPAPAPRIGCWEPSGSGPRCPPHRPRRTCMP